MYTYKAEVVNIVDGDTFDIKVDVGFSITVKHRFRVNNFDAPESWRPKTEMEKAHGEAAKLKAADLLLDQVITIVSYKLDIYGRYSADITLPDGRDYATVMTELGLAKFDSY